MPAITIPNQRTAMITIEALIKDRETGKVLASDELALSDPYDGGSRERNARTQAEWEARLAAEHPETEIKFSVYLD